MRLRHKPWATEEMEKYPSIVIQDPQQYKNKWNQLFGNDNPIYVEVGTGKGRFLTGMGEQHPDINFIGIEKYDSVIISAMERVRDSEQTNVKFLNEDVDGLLDFFGEGEIDRLFINFTDPWPKNRHAKRRLTHENFLTLYQNVLKKDGEIHFKTDNQALFEYSLHSMSTYGMSLQNVSLDLHRSSFEGNIMTEYEEKFSKKGMRIYRLEARYKEQ
ncbi:tRNA (guanosine(46)-N7)-methyltransferase TrmB [Bacillus sp. FJAT-45037]|uniref:tRNA (guanosine(46)-N7)-methyltransferase TrmB n=1 Tax=Bacillus sp. FJAT-45037 TaxID=2011007 RepID=UPI000C23DC73|nr:tRNA (guanosine(46)-N7)-methyltransferase TrmB [Bacillus sp. FJAT-45037]